MTESESYSRESKEDHPPAFYRDYKSTTFRHPKNRAIKIDHTVTEVTGPLFSSVKLESSEGLDGLFAFATLYSGIDYEKNIILEVRPSIQRVDKALNVIKDYCPGKKSLF